MTAQPETALQMARRHVREGEERLARQETTIANLERGNRPRSAILARGVLATMRTSLDLMKRHLHEIEERSES